MLIRELTEQDLPLAAQLRMASWETDYAGFLPAGILRLDQETARMKDWLGNRAEDHFTLFGAFDGDRLAGFTGGAVADPQDTDCGVELYYLFVDPEYRGRKLSLQLLDRIIAHFQTYRFHEMVVYNFSEAASNGFYRKLGGVVRRDYIANVGGVHPRVDVFAFDLGQLAKTVREKLD
ncbi:MAG: GNAT family N-acetyltransferase [Clostridia bacterium]|nr:GNAT family N-acetyltransferase [Clostridia bacterium]